MDLGSSKSGLGCSIHFSFASLTFHSRFRRLRVDCSVFPVPYDEVDQDSALVEMFGQVGAYKCKYIVAVGALAGLTVSMFGSMFPMPRIVYAMAQDGLIFRYDDGD